MRKVNPEDLRASILQAAIQGKLVPQDPNDEPASVLLEKIREEKKKLVAEGKVKKSKHESFIFRRDNHYYENLDGKEVCIDEEIPFKIPNTWSWMRISNLGQIERGSGIKRNETSSNGLPCIRYGEIYTTYDICAIDIKTKTSEQIFNRSHKASFGDLLITLTGETKEDIGKTIAYLGQNELAVSGDLAILKNHQLDPLFLSYFMASPYAIGTKSSLSTGDQIIHLSVGKLESILIPIPPKSEQLRIVRAIQSVNLKISEFNDTYMSLLSIDSEITNKLQYSILKLAIQGKLVPQDPNDKPVQIQCKNPIIRRDNSYYENVDGLELCLDEQLPFGIPDSWVWCRMCDIVDYGENESVPSYSIPDNSIIIELENIEKNTGRIIGFSKKSSNDNSSRHVFKKGCVLYSKLRPYLNKVVIPDIDGYCSTEIMVLYPKQEVSLEYLQLFLMSPYFIDYAMSKSYGTKMPRLGTKDARKAMVPIPPTEEQQRIVHKVKNLIGSVLKLDVI